MKVKTILLALILCLATAFAMVACFDDAGGDQSGSTSGSEHESTSVHEHVYMEVGETPSTCVEAGVKKHYKCDGCGKMFIKDGDEYVETTEADLALPLAAHSFTGISVKTNPTKTVYTAFEEFKLDGIEVVKTCSVEGCAGEAVEEAAVTFAYETEGAVKLTANMTKVVIKVADFETELAITVNKIIVKLPVIEGKEYTGEAQVAVVPASELYTVTENNGGTAIGEYDVKLTLVDAVNYVFEGVEGAVATVKFAITKTANEITMPESIADITCHGEPVISATAKESATITYVYSTSENGEYGAKPESGFIAGTYYVKAIAAETTNYKETVSAPMSFEVKHAVASWNTEDENVDTGVCICGAALNDVTFNKKVTDARQDVILSAETKAITLGGISEYKAVKSIKYGELDLGNDIAALTIPEGMSDAVHGEQTLAVVVTDDYDLDHTVMVPVTLVTKSITNYDELVNCVTYKKERGTTAEGEDKYNEGKYFILANNINVTGSYSASEIQWANAGRGFAGTLDGRGHSLIGGNMWGGGLFGSIEGGTVKNIKFEKVNAVGANRTLIAGTLFNATLENVEIYIVDKKVITGGAFFGVLASHPVANVTLNNVKIDATGSSLPWIIGHHSINSDPDRYHFKNVEIIADSVGCFTSGNSGKLYLDQVEGLSFKLNGNVDVTDKIDPKQFGDTYEYSYVFEDPWTRYTALKSVKVNDIDITEVADLLTNTLVFGDLTNYISENMFNKTLPFVVEFDAGEGNSVKVTLNIAILDRNEKVELTTRQDVVLKDAAGEYTTFTLNLGADLEGCTITGALFNEENLTVTDGAITFSDAMINGVHGEHTLTVFATKGNVDYNITAPIAIVTESVSTFDRLKELVSIKTTTDAADIKKGKDKYYVLAGDINAGQYAAGAGGSNATYAGFAGTLDGRGHKLIGGTTGGHGLFGGLYGGMIKNITFEGVTYGGTRWNSLIANNIFGATMENVTITVANELDMSGIDTDLAEAEWNNRGLIAFGHTQGLKMTNVTIEAKNAKLFTLFGTGSLSCQKGQYTCDRVNVIVKGLKYLGRTASSSLGINEVSNLTVTIAE